MAWGGDLWEGGSRSLWKDHVAWRGSEGDSEILISAPGKGVIAFTEHILNYVLLCVEHIAGPCGGSEKLVPAILPVLLQIKIPVAFDSALFFLHSFRPTLPLSFPISPEAWLASVSSFLFPPPHQRYWPSLSQSLPGSFPLRCPVHVCLSPPAQPSQLFWCFSRTGLFCAAGPSPFSRV